MLTAKSMRPRKEVQGMWNSSQPSRTDCSGDDAIVEPVGKKRGGFRLAKNSSQVMVNRGYCAGVWRWLEGSKGR